MIKFDIFYPYLDDLKRYIKSKCYDISYCDDILQDTLLYLYLNYKNIHITNPKGLLFNTCKFFINKYQTFIIYEDYKTNMYVTMSCSINVNYTYNSFNIDDKLLNIITNINKDLFIPFKMQLETYSIKEIANILNIPENTVKTRIFRCKKELLILYKNK